VLLWLLLRPIDWEVTTSIDKMLAEDKEITEPEILRKLTRSLSKAYKANAKTVVKLQSLFRFQLLLSLVAVMAWMLVAL